MDKVKNRLSSGSLLSRVGRYFFGPPEARASLENPSVSLLQAFGAYPEVYSGVTVNERTALTLSAVFACVRVIAETLGSISWKVYERLDSGGKREARDHRLWRIVHLRPNREMSAVTLFELMGAHLASWGNAYLNPEYNGQGEVIGLWPLHPRDSKPYREGNRKMLQTTIGGRVFHLSPATDPGSPADQRFIHVPLFGDDGMKGYSVIGMARQAVGRGLASEEHSSRFFGQGAHFPYVITHPGDLGTEGRKAVREALESVHSGLSSHHRIAVLDEGMQISNVGMPHDDAQFLEQEKFTVEQIARFFRMQLHKIQSMEHATFSNIEMQAIEHIRDTIRPYVVRIERVLNYEALTEGERERYFIEADLDTLMRGDSEARSKFYREMWNIGAMTQNEIRAKENMNPLEDDTADQTFVPLNMIPSTSAGQLPASAEDRSSETRQKSGEERSITVRHRLQVAQRALWERAAEHFVLREVRALERALKKALKEDAWRDFFAQEMEAFHREFPPIVLREILPLLITFARLLSEEINTELGAARPEPLTVDQMVRDYGDTFVARHIKSSQGQLIALMELADREAQAAIEERLAQWGEERAGRIAMRESVQSGGALTKTFYAAAGISLLRWVTIGENCPFCQKMHGRVVGVRSYFADKGDTLEAEGSAPMKIFTRVGHPPLHGGCDCLIAPA